MGISCAGYIFMVVDVIQLVDFSFTFYNQITWRVIVAFILFCISLIGGIIM